MALPFLPILERFFRDEVTLGADDHVLVAFSGGADSTALLLALTQFDIPVTAFHLDHGLDPGSSGRAAAAAETARCLGTEFLVERRDVAALRLPGESLEATMTLRWDAGSTSDHP